MLSRRVVTRMLGVDARRVRVLGAGEEERPDGSVRLVVAVRPKAGEQNRCGRCRRRCPGYDRGQVRRWRALDWGRMRVEMSAPAPRVRCPDHGVIVAAVPWARHEARHTLGFEQQAAWCAVEMSGSATARLLRCSWRSVGAMVTRVAADLRARAGGDGLDGLRRIGIDEISHRRGHRYLVVVVDHDRRRLVWAHPERTTTTVLTFFNQLGPERTKALTHISADGAGWIADAVYDRAPHVTYCADPFHVVRWATDALDEVRRATWRQVKADLPRRDRGRRQQAGSPATKLQRARYALWKNPENLTERQQAKLAWIATEHPGLYRAWGLKEGLREVFTLRGEPGCLALDGWLAQAGDCGIPAFVHLAERIRQHRQHIVNTLTHGVNNGLVESVNTKIRLIIRRAFGFHHEDALIALAMLALGGHRPALPT